MRQIRKCQYAGCTEFCIYYYPFGWCHVSANPTHLWFPHHDPFLHMPQPNPKKDAHDDRRQ